MNWPLVSLVVMTPFVLALTLGVFVVAVISFFCPLRWRDRLYAAIISGAAIMAAAGWVALLYAVGAVS